MQQQIRQIVVIIYPGVALAQITGCIELFQFANELLRYQHPAMAQPFYQTQLVNLSGESDYHSGVQTFHCLTAMPAQTDVLIIPGSYAHQPDDLNLNVQLFRQHKQLFQQLAAQGVWIGASCNGAFALAATGLLQQKQATTCWFLADYFCRLFPEVELKPELNMVQQGRLLTAGATTAYIQLCLHLMAEFQGPAFSQQLAKIMLTEPAKLEQAAFLSVQQLAPHQDARIIEIQHYLRKHLAEELDLQQLAAHFAMSPRTLIRRFKQATNSTPMAWLQKLRIDQAKKLLETTLMPVEHLVQAIGYEDVSSFRKLFQQYTSLSPKVYRERFYLS